MSLRSKVNDPLTESQARAVAARGNVLVMAGAGTGKTRTLVARCLDCLDRERVSLDELLIVTFTTAAATEMRQRLRRAMEAKVAAEAQGSMPSIPGFWNSQLALFDIAHIGTLHAFCLKLVREHFYRLNLDPLPAILETGAARQLASETLEEMFQSHYAGGDEFSLAVQNLIRVHGGGRDETIRALVLRLHHYSQTRPDAAGWLAGQIRTFSDAEPWEWQRWLPAAIEKWRDEWLASLELLKDGNEKAAELTGILQRLKRGFTREIAAEVLEQVFSANSTDSYPKGKAGKLRPPLGDIFKEARFLADLAPVKNGNDPLAEDWTWVRGHMETLLRLAQEFAANFTERKRSDGVLDFHDLEQSALKLLWDFAGDKPTGIAETWRQKLRFVFVDEYQDINAAQDKIISTLSRDARRGEAPGEPVSAEPDGSRGRSPHRGNRFLVGDVKQSIYRFRQADPSIFRAYARDWHGDSGQVIPLAENFRSRKTLLDFVNSVFGLLMRPEIGGVEYNAGAQLKPGEPPGETAGGPSRGGPGAELLLRLKTGRGDTRDPENDPGANELADLDEAAGEARLLAMRLGELQAARREIWDDGKTIFRPVEWRDMAVLLRAPTGKAEIFARQFELAGVPLHVERGGFYDSSEISDLLSLLQLLDNPLQDVPCIAVLRSPLVGCSLDELAELRLAASGHFWFALKQFQNSKSQSALQEKIAAFLERFHRWRRLAQQSSLSQCLEAILAETQYDGWLPSRPRGAQRRANVGRFLNLAEKFDQFQRQGLYRFLQFITAQREAEAEPEVAAATDENAVRLMSIHQSKGLEFPVVAVANLAKAFNTQDLRGEIIFDEELGLCPKVKPPHTNEGYPSLAHWLAQRQERREQAGEELRLLYVAVTRARDTLLLSGSLTEDKWSELWNQPGGFTPQKILTAKSYADWLGLWFAQQPGASPARHGELPNLCWRVTEDTELPALNAAAQEPDADVELPDLDEQTMRRLQANLTWQYPHDAATKRTAKSSVTALRREAAESEEEALQLFRTRPVFAPGDRKLSAADAGLAHHKFLQRFSLEKAGNLAALQAEAGRLERENILSAEEHAVLDLTAIASFWNSAPGQKIRAQSVHVKRELEFTAKFSPAELDEILGTKSGTGFAGEFIVVQGVADLVVLLPEEIWLVDFKTDKISNDETTSKIKLYAPQLKLYARALQKIYSQPVTTAWLHFLAVNRTEKIVCAD